MNIHAWLQHYGYLALTLGCFAEGDTFLLAGAFLARHKQFFWQTVFIIGASTAIVHGQLCFYLGSYLGRPLLDRFPVLQARAGKIEDLLRRRQRLLITVYRMIFGLRTIAPILIGMSGVSAWRFALFNALGAVLWSACYTLLGYLLGQAVELLIGRLQHDTLWIVLVAVLIIALSSVYYAWHKRQKNSLENG